jgi:hypothetical protein
MEMIDVIAKAHFDDSRLGSISRKQRLRIQKALAQHLADLGLVDLVDPPQAVAVSTPKTEPEVVGGGAPSTLSPPALVSDESTATLFRRGRRKKTSE